MAIKQKSFFRFSQSLVLIGAIILLSALGWITAKNSAYSEAQKVQKDLQERISVFKNFLQAEINRVELMTDILSQHPSLFKALNADKDSDLQKRFINKSNIILQTSNDKMKTSDIFLMDHTGLTIAASNYKIENTFIGKNYAFRPYFKQAVTNHRGAFLAIGVTSKELGFYLSRAIYDEETLVGVLVAKIDLRQMRELVKDFQGDFLLSDRKGVIFFSSLKHFELKSIRTISANDRVYITKTKQYPINDIKKLDIKLSNEKFRGIDTISINGTDYFQAKDKIPGLNWDIWIIDSVISVQNKSISNSFFVITLGIISLIAFYLIYRRRKDKDRFQIIVDNLPSGVTLFDSKLNMLLCNEALKQILDFPESLFSNGLPNMKSLLRYNVERGEYGEGDPEYLFQKALDQIKERQDHTFERQRPNGTVLEVRGKWLDNNSFVTTYTDITERKKAEDEAKRNASYLQALLQHLDQGVTVTDEHLNIVYWNKAFFRLLELPSSLQTPDMKYEDLIRYNAERGEYGPGDPEQHVQIRVQAALKFEPHHFERTRPNGRTLEVTGKPLEIDGQPFGFITTYVDITEHKRMTMRLRTLANTDDLTNLNNRRHFTTLLEREIKRCKRNGQPLSVLMLNLDHFKKVNDQFGHLAGDKALQDFAKVCQGVLRTIDVMGRLGGEEFCIYLPDTDREGAYILAERLRKAVEATEIDVNRDETVHLSVSIGVAVYDSELHDRLEDVMQRADSALLKAKSQGRNKVI